MDKQSVLLDDGEFYIERNCNGDAATSNGFLLRRCPVSLASDRAQIEGPRIRKEVDKQVDDVRAACGVMVAATQLTNRFQQLGKQERQMARADGVLYTYKCAECGHRGEQRRDDDSHDGEATTCASCGAPVTLEWDGGVTLETPKTIADEAIARARERK